MQLLDSDNIQHIDHYYYYISSTAWLRSGPVLAQSLEVHSTYSIATADKAILKFELPTFATHRMSITAWIIMR